MRLCLVSSSVLMFVAAATGPWFQIAFLPAAPFSMVRAQKARFFGNRLDNRF